MQNNIWKTLASVALLNAALKFVHETDCLFTVVGSTVEFRQKWGFGTSVWTASLTCTLDLPVNYSPTGAQQGFYMKILLEDHATDDIMVNSIYTY